jgi:hypothetical protein
MAAPALHPPCVSPARSATAASPLRPPVRIVGSTPLRWAQVIVGSLAVSAVLAFVTLRGISVWAPLLFGPVVTVGPFRIYADGPLPPTLTADVAVADSMVRAHGGRIPDGQRVFLCSSPLRFFAVALRGPAALDGLYNPISGLVVVSPTGQDATWVEGVGPRRLAIVLAHESGHAVVNAALPWWVEAGMGRWKGEGLASLYAAPADADSRPFRYHELWETGSYFRARVEMTYLRDVEHLTLVDIAADRRPEAAIAALAAPYVAASARDTYRTSAFR